MSHVVISKANFIIDKENVKPALDAILEKYSNIKSYMRNYEIPAYNLQYAFHILGYHVRIHQTRFLFGLSKTKESSEHTDTKEFLRFIGPYARPGSYVELYVNGIPETMFLNRSESQIQMDKIVYEQEQMGTPEKQIKKIDEKLAEEISDEIQPEVVKTEQKTMAEMVAEAITAVDTNIEKNSESEKKVDESLKNAITKITKEKSTRKYKKTGSK